jgi:carbon storage regulator
MLVLSRRVGEKLVIGPFVKADGVQFNIEVEVRRVAGNRVTIAIDAPKEIRLLRGELLGRIANEMNEK